MHVSAALTEYSGKVVKQTRFNPKALRAPEMYGEVRHNKRPHLGIRIHISGYRHISRSP